MPQTKNCGMDELEAMLHGLYSSRRIGNKGKMPGTRRRTRTRVKGLSPCTRNQAPGKWILERLAWLASAFVICTLRATRDLPLFEIAKSRHKLYLKGRVSRLLKFSVPAILFAVAIQFPALGNVLLSPGDSYVFDFTLPYAGPAQSIPATATIWFSGGNAGQNWTAQIEFFANSLAETPPYTDTYTHTGPVPPFDEVGRGVSFDPTPWADLQGVVRVTSVSGQFQLDSLTAQQDAGGGYYYGNFAAVPEPSAGLLFLGALALGLAMRRAQK